MAKRLTVKSREDIPQQGVVELFIYGEIGESWWDDESVTASAVAEALSNISKDQPINLRINSPGGDVSHGLAIYNQLRQRSNVTAYIDGYALSAASFIALAADTVVSPVSSVWMIHNPMTIAFGDATELRHQAEVLDTHLDAVLSIYVDRSGMSEKEIRQLLDDETWITGAEAVELGFATRVSDDPVAVEQRLPRQYKVSVQNSGKREKLMAMGWTFGRTPIAANAKSVKEVAMTNGNELNKEVEQLRADLSETQAQLGALRKTHQKAALHLQYMQLRAVALQHVALTNRLTEDEFAEDFGDITSDLEKLEGMTAEDAAIELKVIGRSIDKSARRDPMERVSSEAGKTKLSKTEIESRQADGDPGKRQENPVSPTGQTADDYAQRLIANLGRVGI